ncbi:MAG TPA: cytochrome c [Nitrospiraceae bacterium]|jgi:mono/diheme cytochrome c family protein
MTKITASLIAVLIVVTASSWVTAQGRTARGQVLYDEHCARCHGLTGKGDGPDAARLTVPPANFHTARSKAMTDFELLTAISYGIAFSPMHAWRGRVTDEELLELVRYLRELAPYTPSL